MSLYGKRKKLLFLDLYGFWRFLEIFENLIYGRSQGYGNVMDFFVACLACNF